MARIGGTTGVQTHFSEPQSVVGAAGLLLGVVLSASQCQSLWEESISPALQNQKQEAWLELMSRVLGLKAG